MAPFSFHGMVAFRLVEPNEKRDEEDTQWKNGSKTNNANANISSYAQEFSCFTLWTSSSFIRETTRDSCDRYAQRVECTIAKWLEGEKDRERIVMI